MTGGRAQRQATLERTLGFYRRCLSGKFFRSGNGAEKGTLLAGRFRGNAGVRASPGRRQKRAFPGRAVTHNCAASD